MSAPGADPADPPHGAGGPGAAYACDLHLARCAPLCAALGGLDWSRPVVWFHDFGLLPLAGGRQLRLGVTPPGAATAPIRALTATLYAPATGAIATQEFPLAPYANRERDAASAISLGEQGGRFAFVRGPAHTPLVDAERRRLATVCRAIEAWAALLSGAGLPDALSTMALPPQGPAGAADQRDDGDAPDQLVVLDEADVAVHEPARAR